MSRSWMRCEIGGTHLPEFAALYLNGGGILVVLGNLKPLCGTLSMRQTLCARNSGGVANVRNFFFTSVRNL